MAVLNIIDPFPSGTFFSLSFANTALFSPPLP